MPEVVDPKIEVIDESNPMANMYGCLPCPKCGSRYRWPDQQNVLRCDDCKYLCKWVNKSKE